MAVVWKKLAYEVDVIKLSVMTEIGDIIYCSSLGPPVVASPLAHGNTGDVLTSAGHGLGPAWAAPAAPAAHTLNSHTAANGAVDFGYQLANYMSIQTVVNVAGLPATTGTAKVGQICWATAELSLHMCTEST